MNTTPITFVCYKWARDSNGRSKRYREEYVPEYVNILHDSVRRNKSAPMRFICVTDDPEGLECETFPLWTDLSDLPNPSGTQLPGCYRRLKIFDPSTTAAMGIPDGSPVVSLDVDAVITGDLDDLFKDQSHDFMGFRGRHALHPTCYNGSMYMFKAGTLAWVWHKFIQDPERMSQICRTNRFFGSDQGYLSYLFAKPKGFKAPGWDKEVGVLSYSSDLNQGRSRLPKGTRIVFFNGKLKPWSEISLRQSPWIKEHWRRNA